MRLAGLLAFVLAAAPCLAGEPSATLPRLAGTVLWSNERLAIFVDSASGLPTELREGDRVGGYRIETVAAGYVVLGGSAGARTLTVEDAAVRIPREPEPPATLPATAHLLATVRHDGAEIGRLATERDACAQRGLAPPLEMAAAAQAGRLLDAMARVPPPTGAEAGHGAPVGAITAAMRSGFETARAQDRAVYSARFCDRIASLWTERGGEYGFR